MVKTITFLLGLLAFISSCKKDKDCNKETVTTTGAREWFTAIETSLQFNAATKDTHSDLFYVYLDEQWATENTDESDEALCPALTYVTRTMVYKATKTRDLVSLHISGTDNDLRCGVITCSDKASYNYGYTFRLNDPGTLSTFDGSYSNLGRYIGDTAIEGKSFPDVYVITPPTGPWLGYNKEMYISKTWGLLAWKVEGEHDWRILF